MDSPALVTGGAATGRRSGPVGLGVRAARLPFTTASAIPYCAGAVFAPGAVRPWPFALGLAAVVATHLGANLTNDVADARSGADAADPTYYGLFGGSKLIQQGRLTAATYRRAAIVLAAVATGCVAAMTVLMRSPLPAVAFAGIAALAWMYSCPPAKLSYRRLGEATVALLFGPMTVVGGYYLQTGRLDVAAAWMLSLPMGLLTAGILIANEVPDVADDAGAGKRNLVQLVGVERAWLLYLAVQAAGLGILVGLIVSGVLTTWAWPAMAAGLPIAVAAVRLRRRPTDKRALLWSSKLTILAQAWLSVWAGAGAMR